MLLRFGAKNILSFNEGFEISLVLSSNCPDTISRGKAFTNVLCLKGPNASGKSNAIKALTFIHEFCCNSFNSKPEEEIGIIPFLSNSRSSSFFAEFLIDGVTYFYEVELTRTEVQRESLKRKVYRTTDMFIREGNTVVYNIRELNELKKIKMRKNVSTISMAHQFDIEGIRPVFSFFSEITSNIDSLFGERYPFDAPEEISSVTVQYNESKELFDFVREKLTAFDTGIDSISVKQFTGPDGGDFYLPVFEHKAGDASMSIPYYLESNGTKALYSQLGLYKHVLDTGGVLLLDEFDTNLHPDILFPLVDLFLDERTNPNNAQFIFTTHNSKIMDYLGKYRIVLVNKEENESFLYRLDEIPGDLLRNDRSIESVYDSGKIGGKPRISDPSM